MSPSLSSQEGSDSEIRLGVSPLEADISESESQAASPRSKRGTRPGRPLEAGGARSKRGRPLEAGAAQAATAARARRAAAEGRPGHHQCLSHRRRGGSGADRPSISGGARLSSGRRQVTRE